MCGQVGAQPGGDIVRGGHFLGMRPGQPHPQVRPVQPVPFHVRGHGRMAVSQLGQHGEDGADQQRQLDRIMVVADDVGHCPLR
jgi:hypothetical protein